MTNVLFFNEESATRIELTGGKGTNLAKMTQANFPVPFGFIVTSQAYQHFIEQATFLNGYLKKLDFNHPDIFEQQANQLRQKLKNVALPNTIINEIKKGLKKFPKDTYFSVRSSSTMEDLSGAAFAGQHDTFLNCHGTNEIIEKVKDCFISLWHDRAILYRHQQGFTQNEVTMAVVVQKMVHAEKAGVGFSINPINSNVSEIVINANYGLGESVVSGEAEVDQFIVSKQDFKVLTTSIAHKKICILPTPTGTIEKAIKANLANKSCLSKSEIKQIATLNRDVEKHYSFPQDIEWAIENGKLYLLQARPITTIAPHWTRDESAERYPNVLTPFTWDFVERAFHVSLKHSFELMGLPPFNGKWFTMFDNYIYGNQNAVWLYMNQSPFNVKSFEDLIQQLPAIQKRFSYAITLPKKWMRHLDNYLQDIGALMAEDVSKYNIKQTWDYAQRIVHLGTEYFKPNIAISITQAMLYKILKSVLGLLIKDKNQVNLLFDALISTNETRTAQVNNELYDLAQMILQDKSLCQKLTSMSTKTFLSKGYLKQFPEFEHAFNDFLNHHGHRETDFDYYIPTWIEQPNVVLDNIILIVNNPKSKAPGEKEQALLSQKYEAVKKFIGLIPDNLKLFVYQFLALVDNYTVLDDVEHYQTTRLTLPIRKAAKALGQHLVKKKIISDPMDVFFARLELLERCIQTNKGWNELKISIQTEKKNYHKNAKRIPAWDLNVQQMPSEKTISGDILTGLAGSAGVAEWKVYLIHSTADFATFPKDTILVARTTNPAWTPLFYNAKALITESGGPLSHGAVTAREMKLPAVMSVRNVMKLLKNGQKVRVDGNTGKVYLMKK